MNINASYLKNLRTERGWTQAHLAEAADLSIRTVQRMERYGTSSQDSLLSVCAVLDVDAKSMIDDSAFEVIKEQTQVADKPSRRDIAKWVAFGALLGSAITRLVPYVIELLSKT